MIKKYHRKFTVLDVVDWCLNKQNSHRYLHNWAYELRMKNAEIDGPICWVNSMN